ncbi:DUF1196 domain-containing protein [Vibrio cholerae]|nr:DUF1196 domain-containing protein [Vibrio cholerae]EGR4344429.1 DUF1196 domain-containing protein [Vibrio cholerae]TXZ04062.1 DUF1196 domain-containing protein [Vibrio cholerae]TYA79273.1 DUF1196 domain-containing protein [Vibrio cholerae]
MTVPLEAFVMCVNLKGAPFQSTL